MQLYDRVRTSVYWEEEPTEVRRCSWFYKGDADSRFIPYSEDFSEKLEVGITLTESEKLFSEGGHCYFFLSLHFYFCSIQTEYKKAVSTNQWHRRLEFPSGETIVMHNPKVTPPCLRTGWLEVTGTETSTLVSLNHRVPVCVGR